MSDLNIEIDEFCEKAARLRTAIETVVVGHEEALTDSGGHPAALG